MAITKLDPDAALVLIDLQKGIVGFPTVHPVGEIRCPGCAAGTRIS